MRKHQGEAKTSNHSSNTATTEIVYSHSGPMVVEAGLQSEPLDVG